MADIFISYSKGSHSLTEQLANELRAKGFSVWYDTSLVPGDSFRNVIMSELAQARAAIVIWTATSVKSEWVCSEASRARARHILIPVRTDDIRSHDIPPPFDALHTEQLSNRAAIDAALAKLGVTPSLAAQEETPKPATPMSEAAVADAVIDGAGSDKTPGRPPAKLTQEIKYCRAPDGVRLAYAVAGNGPPLVKAANWMNHLEYDWQSPIWRHVLHGLARDHTLVRYDARGNGMSDWEVGELSLDAWVSDLETVVDAAGVKRFPLLGISQGCAVSVAYATRHPERVSHLVLYGGFALGGRKRSPEESEKRNAMMTLMRLGWGADNPTFRQLFTGLFIPGGTSEQADFFNELQRLTTSPECAARYYDIVGDIDISDVLGTVTTPTLVMHVRGDLVCPIEAGRQLATGIPGARFVALQGQNHLFLEHEPAAQRFLEEIRHFLGT